MPSQCRNNFGVDSVKGDLIFEHIESSRKYLKSYGIVYLGIGIIRIWIEYNISCLCDLLKGHQREMFFYHTIVSVIDIGRLLAFFAQSESAPRFVNNMRTLEGQYFNHMRLHIILYKGPNRTQCILNFQPASQKNFTLRILLMR